MKLTHIADVIVRVTPPLGVGGPDDRTQAVIPIVGGRMDGPLLRGEVLPGGADWPRTRADGRAEIWARYTVRTHDGVVIMVTNAGLATRNADGSWSGRTVPAFDAGTSQYRWLHDAIFVGSLEASAAGDHVALGWYRVD